MLPIFSYTGSSTVTTQNADESIQRVVKGMALKMRLNQQLGCHYIQSLYEFMTIAANISTTIFFFCIAKANIKLFSSIF